MFVTGIAVVVRAQREPLAAGSAPGSDLVAIDAGVIGHDVKVFGGLYAIAIAVAFLPADLAAPRWAAAVVLTGLYVRYVAGHLGAAAPGDSEPPGPLRLGRLDPTSKRLAEPRLRIVFIQVSLALAAIIAGAFVFVLQVEDIARTVGLDETLLALVIAPVATELPEKLNSVIWIGRHKDALALGNITGAMVFQAAIPTSIALLFASSEWSIGAGSWVAFASAGVALVSTAVIFGPMLRTGRLHGRGLLVGGAFYLAQLGLVVLSLSDRAGV
jgi:cation:H+ antiporter